MRKKPQKGRGSRFREYLPLTQEFDALFERASGGDQRAEQEIRKKAAALAKRVNRQIRAFEREGVESAAFQRVQYFLSEERGAERFRERTKTADLALLEEDVEAMGIFLRSEGYSIAEAKIQEEQSEKLSGVLAQVLGEVPDGYIAASMNELFRTQAWQEIKRAHGKSTGLIFQAQDAFERGRLVDDLIAAYEEFTTSTDENMDITKVWKRFTGKRWSRSKK